MGRRKRVTEGKGFVGPLDGAHTINSAKPLSRKARTGWMPKKLDPQGYPEEHQIEHTGEIGLRWVQPSGQGKPDRAGRKYENEACTNF